MRRALHDAQVPVRLQRAQLRGAQESQCAALRVGTSLLLALDGVLEDLADSRELVVVVAGVAPLGDSCGESLVKVGHRRNGSRRR